MVYPENTIWLVRAFADDQPRTEGSAVAVRLQKIVKANGTERGGPATARTYLLTCAHVIRNESADGAKGCGPVLTDIRAWRPGFGFDPQKPTKVKLVINEPTAGDVPVGARFIGIDDWVVLAFEDDSAAKTFASVKLWVEGGLSGNFRLVGLPGGEASFDRGIVTPTQIVAIPYRDELKGELLLTGDESRSGMSGGGVFTEGELRFAGLHRGRMDEAYQLREVSAQHIRDRLREFGYEVAVPADEPTGWYKRYVQGLRDILQDDDSFKKHEVDFQYKLAPVSTAPASKLPAPSAELTASAPEVTIDADTLCDMVVRREIHGALICGAGGSGKSAYLGRIARRLLDSQGDQFCPVVIAAGYLMTDDLDAYFRLDLQRRSLEGLEKILETGLRMQARDAQPIAEIRGQIGGRGIFFLIDGINEVNVAARDQGFFDEICRRIGFKPSGDRCIVTARSRLVPAARLFWKVFEVAAIGNDSLDSVLASPPFKTSVNELLQIGQEKLVEILKNPFFLQMVRESGTLEFDNRAGVLLKYFTDPQKERGIGIKSEELEKVGEAALAMYRQNQRTWFDLADMAKILGQDPRKLRKLLEGSLDEKDGLARFSHQLKHDFLVSYYLYSAGNPAAAIKAEHAQADFILVSHGKKAEDPNPTVWRDDNLDGATFYNENRDPLTLAVEQFKAESVARNDVFLRCVYNWHLGAAFSCLMADNAGPAAERLRRFSLELRIAMLALLADKRENPIRHTRNEHDDWALRLSDPHDREFFDRGRDVRAIVSAKPPMSGWFEKWRKIFGGDRTALLQHLPEIAGDDQVLAWTIANACRSPNTRKLEDAGYLARMIEELANRKQSDAKELVAGKPNELATRKPSDSTAIARWRIVHALSAFGGADYAAEAVFQRLNDEGEYVWVRYGAGRAIVEMAALQPAARQQELLERLTTSVKELIKAKSEKERGNVRSEDHLRILREIGRSVLYKGVEDPARWVELVDPLFGLINEQIQKDPRYRQAWRNEVLTPYRDGDWIGAKPLPKNA